MKAQNSEKTQFLLSNLLKGLLWLTIIIGGYVVAKRYFQFDLAELMGPLYEQPITIFSIFLVSEVVFGIIPPEFFMLWAARHGDPSIYIQNVVALAFISYGSGVIGYFLGAFFNTTQLYKQVQKRFLKKMETQFNRFGGFLVVVAALTPLPFSGICMLVGAVKYPMQKFLLIALMRFLRFGLYAYVVWEANSF